ncbi:glycine/sarcosine/betaine reductase component B subunit [Brevibacillus sp. WF146]|uniref:glycine/sarcosine/betaine reductase component B subunit n=1 Tax=Brevibacillus sp. WF146 TaxID=319501 RepID=UPI0007ED33F9|nr:glycine/sarcosine/betaine reductase component B subunit [Brevibacillus sp. WF146]UYZ12610.1 glycine/sarcosine/betaine reductase component B subunit [Brevibacillus sp. WF146]
MRLEIGNFHVKDIVFGETTSYQHGVLTINKEEALQVVYEDDHITEADLVIAKPGDPIRITPVKEAIEPRCKVSGGVMFPGVTNKLVAAGNGRTHALKGSCVLAVGKHWGGFQDGLIDMSGPAANQTMFSQLLHICLVADTDEEFERHEQQKKNKALRWAGMRLAEYIGECVRSQEPEELEVYELPPLNKRDSKVNALPRVVYVMQLQSQMLESGYNALVYGWDANHMVPTLMHPNELLDGAIISGSFMPCSSKISTYQHVNNATIKRLMKEHGRTINFLGVIVSNLNVQLEQKVRSALFVRQLATSLGAEGAIVCEEGYGNPDADFILVINELVDAGIKVVGITNECTGRDGRSQSLVDLSEKADAIVSTGNVSQLLSLPPMKIVIGELASLARDGNSGGWEGCVKEDGSIIMENNGMFCSDANTGEHYKTVVEY